MNVRPTFLEIDLNNFLYNIEMIQNYVGNNIKLIPVIKANAYGTYINKRLDIISMFDIVSVALVDEALELRSLGYKGEILVLNQPYIDEIDKIIKYDITIGLSEISFLDEVGKRSDNIKVHLEVDTGMGRTGVLFDNIDMFIKRLKSYSNILVDGVYTHLSSADDDEEYTYMQLGLFEKCISLLKENFNLKYIHSSASNGILNYKNSYFNAVRPGIIMYGYESFIGSDKLIKLRPVCKLRSRITFLKEVEKGISIGYSRGYITNKKTKVATIPIGYADGIRRSLSNKGFVIISGKKLPIIGKICMDSFMVDVSSLDEVKVGDVVYIFDNDIITIDEIASLYDTINYEVISTISNRVPRVFKIKNDLS